MMLDCIRGDHLRCRTPGYARLLEQVEGKVGAGEARLQLKKKLLDAIREAYPELADECDRQRKLADNDMLWW
jgi:hypothetical protein